MGNGRDASIVKIKKIEVHEGSSSLSIEEDGVTSPLSVRAGRRGLQAGCTFISYEALDELHRMANADAPMLII